MALSDKEIASDAGDVVTDLVAALAKHHMTYEDELTAMKDAAKVFKFASQVLEVMIKNSKPPVIH